MTPEQKLEEIMNVVAYYNFYCTSQVLKVNGELDKVPTDVKAVASVLSAIVDIIHPETTAEAQERLQGLDTSDPKEVMNAVINAAMDMM